VNKVRPCPFQYTWTLTTESSPAVEALFSLAKSRLPTALETKFAEFPVALIETHGKDLTVSADPSRSGTPSPSTLPIPASSASTSTSTSGPTSPLASEPLQSMVAKMSMFNTTKVTVKATFMADADVLFGLLTDENKIPSWTRASAKVRVPRSTLDERSALICYFRRIQIIVDSSS
jgi:activator of HSP90 ATPase